MGQQQLAPGDDISYAVIKDTDKFVNIRKSPGSKAPIIGKIYKYTIFSCQPYNSNWWKVYQTNANDQSKWSQGYIYKSRVELLSKWKTVKAKSIFRDSCKLKADSLIVTVKKAGFNPNRHKLSHDKSFVTKIDGVQFWGRDGNLPKEVITLLKISKNGLDINVPKKAYYDLCEPNFETLSICIGPENTNYIKMDNSDGAGGYTIIWIIKENKYLGRYIDISFE